MITFNFDTKQFDKLIQQFPEKSKKAIAFALGQSADECSNLAKQPDYCPYKTGNLRRSITTDKTKVRKGIALFGTDVKYGRIREFNTRSRPRGYLRPALKDSIPQIKKFFINQFKLIKA